MKPRIGFAFVALITVLLSMAAFGVACGGEAATTAQVPATASNEAVTTTQTVPVPPTASAPPDSLAEAPGSVLVVGNSLVTGYGGLAAILKELAAGLDPPRLVETQAAYQFGGHLRAFYNNIGILNKLRAGGYDVVVLTEDVPMYEEKNPDSFYQYGRLFDEEIKAVGGRTVFLMAWPYGDMVPWATLDLISRMHRDLGSELGAPVAPAGLAFARSDRERPDLRLLEDDWGHPSEAGSYLSACVLYGTLFGESPEGSRWTLEGMSAEDAAFLQKVGWESVQDWLQQ